MKKNLTKSLGIFLSLSMAVGMMPGMAMTALADTTTTYSFADGFQGWTTIDADGDGYAFVTVEDMVAIQNEDIDLFEYGVGSFSFINYDGPYDPDNYLVSPQINLGGSLEFDMRAGNNDYPDHVGVCVSTTGTNPADFTTIAEFDVDWYGFSHLTVDLSAYEGAGYVAFRHFNSYDEYLFVIRDVVITQPDVEVGPGPIVVPPAESNWLDPIRGKLH